jgi:hypothetical protein
MRFDDEILKILEGHNVYPRAKAVQGRQAPVPSTNINSQGVLPSGFKGAGVSGFAPTGNQPILIKWPEGKKRKKLKKKKDFSS